MKLIHLSDIHVGHEDCGAKFRTIAEKIMETKQPVEEYIIIITGDIVNNANREEYISEALGVISMLREKGYRLLLIPGNHDYGTGVLGNKKFVQLFKEKFYSTTNVSYPKLDIIDDVAFIGLDSTAEELHWLDRIMSEGELGRKQRSRLKKILKQPEVAARKKVVYLHHHPFYYKIGMQLKDRDKLKKLIEGNIDLLLFGHYHQDPEGVGSFIHGTWDIPRCYNAGSATHKNGEPGYHRVIDIYAPNADQDYDAKFL
ncbi:MAG TPA: metallophosphoesterase [Bacteroidales bacterium]|nr:metallophosphoesterase [Bacteroidales bacterium]HPT11765.1 metallophosphoesterase [Bacteroidales bacterium]